VWHAFWVTVANLVFYTLYHFGLLNKYKVTKKPWPWEIDSEGFRKLARKTIINTVLNGFLTLPIV